MVERAAFHNLPEMVKLELCNNPRLSYMDPQAFRCAFAQMLHKLLCTFREQMNKRRWW